MKMHGFFAKLAIPVAVLFFLSSFAGCSDSSTSGNAGSKYSDWADTDGSAGRINMEAVAAAMDQASDPSDLEARINEIYDGAETVLIRVATAADGRKEISGWADMNANGTIDADSDDELFSALMGEKEYELAGHGVNSHYAERRGLSVGDALFLAWVMSPSYYPYYTPMNRVTVIQNNRTVYRSSPAYAQQRKANSSYAQKARAANPTAYDKASKKVSPTRKATLDKSRKSFDKRSAAKPKSTGSGFMKKSSSPSSKSSSKSSFGSGFMKKSSSSSGSRSRSSSRSSSSSRRR